IHQMRSFPTRRRAAETPCSGRSSRPAWDPGRLNPYLDTPQESAVSGRLGSEIGERDLSRAHLNGLLQKSEGEACPHATTQARPLSLTLSRTEGYGGRSSVVRNPRLVRVHRCT